MLLPIVVGLAITLTCLLLMRKMAYGLFDPLVVTSVSIPFAGSMLATLCSADLVAWNKFLLFGMVLLAYLLGARTAGLGFHAEDLRRQIVRVLSAMTARETQGFLTISCGITLLMAVLAWRAGAQGDARQEFGKLFRPLVLVQNGSFLISLVLLLSPKLSKGQVTLWLSAFVGLSIAYSGKGILAPVIFWFGLKLFLRQQPLNWRIAGASALVVFASVAAMGYFAYGMTSGADLMYLLFHRLWLSGDTYIYAYQWDALSRIRATYNVSFLPYMLHPFLSLVGLRAYEKPLGGMMFEEIWGTEELGGPNPHLPVLLDFFFPDSLLAPVTAAFAIGFLVLAIRSIGMLLADNRSRYLRLGAITAAIFCPAMGFIDTSQVAIMFIGIAAMTFFGLAMELISSRDGRRQGTSVRESH